MVVNDGLFLWENDQGNVNPCVVIELVVSAAIFVGNIVGLAKLGRNDSNTARNGNGSSNSGSELSEPLNPWLSGIAYSFFVYPVREQQDCFAKTKNRFCPSEYYY
jgi:hypothetical protein